MNRNDASSSGEEDSPRIARGRTLTNRFTMVPQWAMLHPELSDAAYRLYCLLLARVNRNKDDGKVWPSQETLAEMLRCHRNTIGRLVSKELEVLGFVTVVEERCEYNRLRRRNVYYVHEVPPDDWQGIASLEEWDASKNAGQPGRPTHGASGRPTDGASGGPAHGASGRTTGGAVNKRKEEQEEVGNTHAADAASVSPEVVDRLCRALADAVKARGVKRPEITAQWRKAVVTLMQPDSEGHSYTVEEIEGGITWAQEHPWWSSRTNTMAKFAKHFATMKIQANGDLANPSTVAGKAAGEDLMQRRIKALDEAEAAMEKIAGRRLNNEELKALRAHIQEEVQ